MTESTRNNVFSRLKHPLAMIAGAVAMAVLGLAVGRFLGQQKPDAGEENYPTDGENTQTINNLSSFSSDDSQLPDKRVAGDQSVPGGTTGADRIANQYDAANNNLSPGSSLPPEMQPGYLDPGTPADIRIAAGNALAVGGSADSFSSNSNLPNDIKPSTGIDLLDTDVFGSQVALADEQLRIGNYARALQMYQLLAENASGVMLAPLQFRLALCAELSGSFPEAIDAYRRVSGSSTALEWNGVALVGEARCLIASDRFDVLQSDLLRRTLLDETTITKSIQNELLHLIGRSFWEQLNLGEPLDLLNDNRLVVPIWHPDPNAVLDELPRLLERPRMVPHPPELEILQITESTPDGIYLKIHSTPSSVSRLLQGMLQRCELNFSISEAAASAMGDRRMTIHLNDRSLSLILDAMTLPYGNVWMMNGPTLQIVSFSEIASDELMVFRRLAAERILRMALLDGGESAQASHSRLTLGTLQFQQGKIADAAYTFRSQEEQSLAAGIHAEYSFNLGKCLLHLHQADDSRRSFLRAVDTSSGSADLKVAAYMYAGRLQIELGDTRGAIHGLMRALKLSEKTNLEPRAALLLASNYLMIGNPAGTNSVLMERRDILANSEYKYAGAFLSSTAQLQAAVLPTQREREGRDVVEAISQFLPEQQFGSHWCLLVGEAAEDLGLTETATSAYLKTLAKEPAAPLRNQVMLKLATRYRLDDKLDDARQLLESLGADEADEFNHLASLRSAEIAMQQGRADEAVRTCRKLLAVVQTSEMRRATLRVMGQAFEKQKNYQAAVLCFSGVGLPGDSISSSTNEDSEGKENSDELP
ncbi:MAG: tetratricopeptide repeat protein [Planctomycetaceae bacterium]|nr:tetratricopeptide repeat protein [Planctomycetaceae bacterium]